MIRMFIAVPLNPEVIDAIGRVRDIIGEYRDAFSPSRGFKMVRPENYHITLKFLGDVDEREIPAVKDVMEEAVAGLDPFDITLAGYGGLPRIERPRVVYINVEDAEGRLARIAGVLNEKLSHFRKEKKTYVPHVTFIRVQRPAAWHGLAQRLQGLLDRTFGVHRVECIDLVASELKPSGAEYHMLERVFL